MKFWSLQGTPSYSEVRELQLLLVDLRHQEKIRDTVLFLEHSPVITRGRGLQFTGVPRPKQMPILNPLPHSIAFSESERGGDLTYHGPGQLVMYPICKLDGSGVAPHHDVAGWIRKLENSLLNILEKRGLKPHTIENATGVWVGPKKIASIGIAIRKWVSYHGIALNVVNDLSPFHFISPCGFSPEAMTRLSDFVSLGPNWREELERDLSEQFCAHSIDHEGIESLSVQDAFLKIKPLLSNGA